MAAPSHVLPFLSPSTASASASPRAPSGGRRAAARLRCAAAAGQAGFFTRLGRLIKEKAKSDVDKLLTYWNFADTDRVLDNLEEALLVSDFSLTIAEIKASLKRCFLELLTPWTR